MLIFPKFFFRFVYFLLRVSFNTIKFNEQKIHKSPQTVINVKILSLFRLSNSTWKYFSRSILIATCHGKFKPTTAIDERTHTTKQQKKFTVKIHLNASNTWMLLMLHGTSCCLLLLLLSCCWCCFFSILTRILNCQFAHFCCFYWFYLPIWMRVQEANQPLHSHAPFVSLPWFGAHRRVAYACVYVDVFVFHCSFTPNRAQHHSAVCRDYREPESSERTYARMVYTWTSAVHCIRINQSESTVSCLVGGTYLKIRRSLASLYKLIILWLRANEQQEKTLF